ncbi:MAG: hypothetical protein JXA89_12105 [Anaerolineae bacterium]|nr:hypothetical protein [Anaerolineae bacterium]
MSVFKDILAILTTSNGAIAYYLVLLFSIWAMAGLALSRWSRGERRGAVPRLLMASGLMLFGRFLLFVLALLDRRNGVSLVLFGPPTERLIDALTLVLIAWAFVDALRQPTAMNSILAGLAALLFIGFYIIAVMQWSISWQNNTTLAYNLFWQQWVWEIGQFLFATLVVAYLFTLSVPERGTLVVGLGTLVAGHLLQAVLPFADQVPHFAGWVRFSNLVVFPLLAVSAFRLIVQRFDTELAELRVVGQESLSQVTGLMDLADFSRKVGSSLNVNTVLENAVRSVAQIVSINLCAIGLFTQRDSGEMEIVAAYDSHQIKNMDTRFMIQDYPAVEHAVTRAKPVILDPGENGRTAGIYRLLGYEDVGPLIIQPLTSLGEQATVMGVILVFRPGSTRPFTAVEINKCETLSGHVSIAIRNAQRYRELENRNEQMMADLRLLEMDHARVNTDLENRLKQSQKEMSLYIQKLYEIEVSEQRMHNDLRELRNELHQAQKAGLELEQTRSELEKSIKQVGILTHRVSQLDATRLDLERRVRDMEQQKEDLSSDLLHSQSGCADLEEQVRQLQTELARNAFAADQEGGSANGISMIALDAMMYGVMLCDKGGRIIRLNDVALRFLGDDATKWMGKAAFDMWSDDAWQAAIHSVTDEYAGTPGVGPFTVRQNQQAFDVSLGPLHIGERHVGAVITLTDAQTVDERAQARDEFLSSLAQELRTPMTSIVGYTELLLSGSVGELDDMSRKFLQRVQANIERMGGMLNDLVGVTAIDLGKLVIELEAVKMARIIKMALRKVQFRLEEKNLESQLDIADLPEIYVDPDSMQQILDNLLTNACKSSDAGTTIELKASQEYDDGGNAFLHIAVSDTGGGVAPGDRPRVFDRFYRADDALISGLGETGVGLSIVKALVEAHEGRVWIESEMGQGSTFHFTVPYGLEEKIGRGQKEYSIKGNGYG